MPTMQAVPTVDVPESLREPLAAFIEDALEECWDGIPRLGLEGNEHDAVCWRSWALTWLEGVRSEGAIRLHEYAYPDEKGTPADYARFVSGELWEFSMRASHEDGCGLTGAEALRVGAGLLTLMADVEGTTP